MRSLRSKILLLAICVVVAAQAFTVGGILYNAKEKSREQAYGNLRVGVATADKFMAEQAQGMRLLLLSILDDPSFRKSISSDDSPQIVAGLAKHTSRLIADIVVIVDASGSVLYSATDDLPTGTMISEAPLVNGAPFTSVIDAVAYEMVADNLMFAGKPAYLVIGALIGNEYALQIASITGLQTSFATGSKAGRLFLGSSLDPLDRNLMIASIEEMRSSGTVSNALNEVNRRFVSTRTPFVSKQGQVYLLLHQSLDIALAPYKSLQVFLFYLVATTLLVVGIIVWLVSTLMTRPLHKLSDAVKRITIGDYTKKIEVNTRDEIGALAHVFNAMQDGIEHRESSILQQSLTDPVTGLPNRQHALSILRERIGRGNQIAVLLMDLGRFEHIRSTLGHKVSDEMLRLSAVRIKRSLHEDAMLARLEGDEFLLVIPVSGVDAAINEAETNLALLESGLSIRKARVSLEVHIGISLYPEHGDSADDLLRHASVAKHEAIRSRSPMKVYQEGKGEAHARRLQILSDLRVAIDEHHLELYMQPKVCMTS
ncbi:MAG: diguanylate cyclase, partial [Chromatiales bacterium]|nr:diguanylate cyclase [Chromatiales bacterium]